jgi:hypothetical protein
VEEMTDTTKMDMRALVLGQYVTLSEALSGSGTAGVVIEVAKHHVSVRVGALIDGKDGAYCVDFDYEGNETLFYGWTESKAGWDISWAMPCPIPDLKIVGLKKNKPESYYPLWDMQDVVKVGQKVSFGEFYAYIYGRNAVVVEVTPEGAIVAWRDENDPRVPCDKLSYYGGCSGTFYRETDAHYKARHPGPMTPEDQPWSIWPRQE